MISVQTVSVNHFEGKLLKVIKGVDNINNKKNNFRTTDQIGFKMIPVQVVSVNHFESKLLNAIN